MEPSRIQAVDHVHLEAPTGCGEALQWFYGELAGLDELQTDPQEATLLRFRSDRIELRIRQVPEPDIDAVAVRVTITVPSLDAVAEALDERRIPSERLSGLSYTDQCLQTLDPAGNRLEFRQSWWIGPV